MNAEQENEQRRHQRAAADAGHAHQQADAKARYRMKRIGRHLVLHNLVARRTAFNGRRSTPLALCYECRIRSSAGHSIDRRGPMLPRRAALCRECSRRRLKPNASSGWRGRRAFVKTAFRSALDSRASGLNLRRRPSRLDNGQRRPLTAMKALASADPAVECGKLARQRRNLAQSTTGIAIVETEIALRIAQRQFAWRRRNDAKIGQSQMAGKRVPVGERFLEQPQRIEKQHRQRAINIGDEFQKHGGLGAEGRNHCQPAGHGFRRRLDDLMRCRFG